MRKLADKAATYNQDIREKEEHLMQHRQKHNLKFHTHASIARLANDPIKLQVATFLLAQRTLSEAFHTRQRGGKVIATSKLHQTQCYWNVAISLSSLEAAVEFYHWSQVPDFKELQAETGSPIQDNAAKDLIRNAAQAAIENEGECHWEVVAAYLDIDFNVDDISKRSSVEIKQAIELLRRSRPEKKMGDLTDLPFLEQVKVIFDIAPKSKPKPKSKSKTADFFDLLQTTTATSPCHYMLDLIRESLAGNGQISRARRQPLSAQEREKLHVLRDEALEELREISDPKACFILALRDHDVGSDGWVHNMQHAAVRYSEATNEQTSEEMLIGNPSACWLLASHSCEVALEGGDTITKLNRACTAAQWARECIMSYGAPTSSHALRTSTSSSHCITIRYTGSSKAIGTEIVRRIVAMAAWSKLHDDQGVLRRASADCEDWVKSKGLLSSKMSRKLGEYLRDVPGWNNTQCEKWLDDAMNLDRELMNVEALDEVKWYFEGYKDADTQPP